MTPLSCTECTTEVLVRKASPEQTSIQWLAGSRPACAEFSNLDEEAFRRVSPYGCVSLADSIRSAYAKGEVPVAQ